MTSYILIPFIIFQLVGADAIYFSGEIPKTNVSFEQGMLKGGVSLSKDLPEEFYGTWSVKSTVINADNTDFYRTKSADIWMFKKNGNIITLTNPASGATASITVNEVKNKTATFTRKKDTAKEKEIETATITVNGDDFFGKDKITTEYYSKGKLTKTIVVEYEVTGEKIKGPRLENLFTE